MFQLAIPISNPMLDLNAFHHLPQLDALFDEIARDAKGLIIVAGLDARAEFDKETNSASGRAVVFGILARRIANADARALIALVTENREPVLHLGSRRRDRLKIFSPKPHETYHEIFLRALPLGYATLFAETLNRECVAPALRAAQRGQRIVTQLDTPLCGAWVARYLRDSANDDASLRGLHWVISVRRLPMLCADCKQRDKEFFRADGCNHCDQTGQRGDITIFDVWRASGTDPLDTPSRLSFQQYAHELAKQGFLAPEQLRDLDAAQLYRTFQLLSTSEQHTIQATQSLRAQVTELELAKRALEQQYRASFALQEVGQKLLQIESVQELAAYICRRARDLCGADRAALYLLHPDQTAEIVALSGWDAQWLHERVGFEELFRRDISEAGDAPFAGYPPGIPKRVADLEGAYVRAGLIVPLIAQREVMGAMIFHSTVRKTFDARDVALLHALANAGAAAMQRADLIDSLRDKIEQLEAAQSEIAKKERLERELELARTVQQNMLPHQFPLLPGMQFYARNEPARQVGGDFYDVFLLDTTRVGVVIADVSDKGMPAALFMALTRSLVRAEAQREISPERVLRRVHRLLSQVAEPTQFVTLFYGVLDLTTRMLTYVRAGHDYPFVVRGDSLRMLDAAGTILGLLEEDELILDEAQIQLEPGDHLVLYTDGLTDAINETQVDFGRAELKRVLRAHSGAPVEIMGNALFDAVLAHQGSAEAFDDMTLLIVGIG